MLIFNLLSRAIGFVDPCKYFFPWGGGSSVDTGDNIANSLMLDSTASQYLSRTISVGSGTTATHRFLVKRGKLGALQFLEGWSNASTQAWGISFTAADQIDFYEYQASAYIGRKTTNAVYRDPSATLDILCVHDTTNTTATDRMRIYVNGVRITSFSASVDISQNTVCSIAGGIPQSIGSQTNGTNYFDGYLTSIQRIDAQALDASYFGRFSVDTGQWVPKNYTGTYGTNGFKLDFANGAALGNDVSGNGNNWTLNGGITSANQYTDTPTNNYCVLNPLNNNGVVSKGNLQTVLGGASSYNNTGCTISVSGGKWYWEFVPTTSLAVSACQYGIVGASKYVGSLSGGSGNAASYSDGYAYAASGYKWNNGSQTAYAATYAQNDVIGVALDLDSGTLTFYKNGISQGIAFSGLTGAFYPVVTMSESGSTTVANFGQRSFAYTPPTGFKSLCTANLPDTGTVTVSGTFTGNLNANGPFIFCNGYPTTLTINGNAVTFATHADRTANGFKLRTASASYNNTGSNTWTATIVSNQKNLFKYANAQGNP